MTVCPHKSLIGYGIAPHASSLVAISPIPKIYCRSYSLQIHQLMSLANAHVLTKVEHQGKAETYIIMGCQILAQIQNSTIPQSTTGGADKTCLITQALMLPMRLDLSTGPILKAKIIRISFVLGFLNQRLSSTAKSHPYYLALSPWNESNTTPCCEDQSSVSEGSHLEH